MPPSLFELRRARKEKAAPQRDEGGTGRSPNVGSRRATCETKIRVSRSSLAGRPCLFASFPALRTGATFKCPLRDNSPAHTTRPWVDAYWARLAGALHAGISHAPADPPFLLACCLG